VNLPKVSAYKLFVRGEDGKLRSAFASHQKPGLFYRERLMITVDEEDKTFFAFEFKEQAFSFASATHDRIVDRWGAASTWDIAVGERIVLPVTLFNVVRKGKVIVPSDDPQCLDGRYSAFEAKQIIVHDSQEACREFYDYILGRYLHTRVHSMNRTEIDAFKHVVPELAPMLR